MGRSPCCEENGLKKGPWTPEEDEKLVQYINKNGFGSWRALPKLAGLNRCGKSCRLRWTNYLRPDIKRGKFSEEEEQTILHLHSILGNKWSAIATRLPGRTDNEIKNFWNTHLKKKLIQMGFDPMTHQPRTDLFASLPHLIALANLKHQYQNLLDHHKQYNSLDLQLLLQNLLLQYDHSTASTSTNHSYTTNIQTLNGNDVVPDQSIMSLVNSVLSMNESPTFSNITQVAVENPSSPFSLHEYYNNNNNNNYNNHATTSSEPQPLHHIPTGQMLPHHDQDHDHHHDHMIIGPEQVPFSSDHAHQPYHSNYLNKTSTDHHHHEMLNMISDDHDHQGSDLTMLSLQGSDGDSATWFNLQNFQSSPSDLPNLIESEQFETPIMRINVAPGDDHTCGGPSTTTTPSWPQSFS